MDKFTLATILLSVGCFIALGGMIPQPKRIWLQALFTALGLLCVIASWMVCLFYPQPTP